jgi:hypothetical protein
MSAISKAGADKRLQISDPTTYVAILRIAGRSPERASRLVIEGDQGGYPTGAAFAQILLAGPRQREPDALPPMPFVNGEPVHVPPPPIPAGDQSADDLTVALGDQKGGRGAGDQALDVPETVRRARVLAPRLGPQPQDRLRILMPTPTYRDCLTGQVGSVAKATLCRRQLAIMRG